MDVWRVGAYLRLSREDGDKSESDSIGTQRAMLQQYIDSHEDLMLIDFYIDDGYTGTNFNRPAFCSLLRDMETGRVTCVLVKDLSRFGRDYIEVGRYIERVFPGMGVRFLAVNDHIDSLNRRYDMMLPIKNLFNTQYARDISDKVRSAIETKQKKGDFIGAFASYGYCKDPQNHNRLVIDREAAPVVQRIFTMFESGVGKIAIAKRLNAEGVPSPSAYKQLMGERYHNGRRLGETTYWTYSTIHRILQNEMYRGNMTQGRTSRVTMHGKAAAKERKDWAVVEHTHPPIIEEEQWERVQSLLQKRTRAISFEENRSPFAGFLRCGDCGRAMVKTVSKGKVTYQCGSYKRYGPTVCTGHTISHCTLETIILCDLNCLIAGVQDLKSLCREENRLHDNHQGEKLALTQSRIQRRKQALYEDYKDGILSKEDYLNFRKDYDRQIASIKAQESQLSDDTEVIQENPWIASLLEHGKLLTLDRVTVAEAIHHITVFADGQIEIGYRFRDNTIKNKG